MTDEFKPPTNGHGSDAGLRFHEVTIQATTPRAAAEELIARATAERSPVAYRLVNSYTFALASRDPEYMRLLRGPGINLPDGKPLAALLDRASSHVQCRQVRGPQLFEDCLDLGRAYGVKHYLLGGSPDTLAKLIEKTNERFPGVEIVGSSSPPFRLLTEDERAVRDRIVRESGADLVWVGLGTPKQDFEALRLVDSVGVTAAAVGAAFDFTAETKRRAPPVLHRLGLEWVFRLATEPRRLWKRYLVGNTQFLVLAARHVWSTRRRG